MRIIAGARRGLKLAEVGAGDPAVHLRPTSDRVREAVFNLLVNGAGGDAVAGARVIDLFAGTGALGLEALSRGASWVTFVDAGAAAEALIRVNVGRMQAQAATGFLRRDATRLGANRGPAHGLAFLDPPYGQGLAGPALVSALAGGWLAPGAMVVCEDRAPVAPPPGFRPLGQRAYGDTWVTLMRAPEGDPA
jgi:16S rRNA (guanine966-N2)-methyltransferase